MDIGGTFTDFVLWDEQTDEYRTGKVSSTPRDLCAGVLEGLIQLIGEDLSTLEFSVHGTTAGLNAFLERKGARVALIATEGFRDVYEIGRGNRPDMYNLHYQKPIPLVRRRDVFEVKERVLFSGEIAIPVDEGAVRHLAAKLRAGGYESVAITLLHAPVNPVNERRVGEVLRQELPDLSLSLSHEVAREWREYERTSTTVLNAYIAPIVEQYLTRLEKQLHDRGVRDSLYVMRSSGGVMTAEVARTHAIQTLVSGPVGGAIGGTSLSNEGGLGGVVGIDMGGTSFDVTLVMDGQVDVANETTLQGFPVLAPMVNIHTIGAGGGSIAWVQTGRLRVGPQSAGSQPGPACYDRGGTLPTVTDANVVLGRIDPTHFLGGRMRLVEARAREVLCSIAQTLGMSWEQAAEGILDVVNAKMADAIRTITIRKGVDPRGFTLVAFGGAGPLHAAAIARELDIRDILVPKFPGAFSAWGMLHSDVKHDEVRTFLRPAEPSLADVEAMESIFADMIGRVLTVLQRQRVSSERVVLKRIADMRYIGQEYVVSVSMPGGPLRQDLLEVMLSDFHQRHRQIYGHCNLRAPAEFVNLRVTGIGTFPRPAPAEMPSPTRARPQPRTVVPVIFGGTRLPTSRFTREDLHPGQQFDGPAIVEEFTATTVVPPGCSAVIDRYGNLRISAMGRSKT